MHKKIHTLDSSQDQQLPATCQQHASIMPLNDHKLPFNAVELRKYAKIPIDIDTTNKAKLKALCVFFALKQIKYNGTFIQFKKNIGIYAGELNMHPNTLRSRINELIKLKLVFFTGIGKLQNLQLAKYECLNDHTNTMYWHKKHKCFKYYFIQYAGTDTKQIELFCITNSIQRNFKAQQYAIDMKKIEFELSTMKTCDKHLIPYEYNSNVGNQLLNKSKNKSKSQLSKLKKFVFKYHANAIDKKWQHAQIEIWASTYRKFAIVNPFVTLSCRGVARVCLGKSAPSTGHYLKQRLQSAGMIDQWTQSLCNVNRKSIERDHLQYNIEHNNLFDRSGAGVYGLRKTWKTIENKLTVIAPQFDKHCKLAN